MSILLKRKKIFQKEKRHSFVFRNAEKTFHDTTLQAVVKLKPDKNPGLNGIRTRNLCDTDKFPSFSAVQIYDLSCIHLYKFN